MSYGYQPAPRKSGLTTAGKWIFFIGLVLSILVGLVTAWGVTQSVGVAERMESDSVSLAAGPQSVDLEAGDTRMVATDSAVAGISCTVTLPDGTQTSLDADAMADSAIPDADLGIVGTFTATTAGEHTFECDEDDTMLMPGIGGDEIAAFMAAGLGFLALIPLGLLTLVGLILWLVGRGRDRRALQQPVGPHGGPAGYGGSYPGDSTRYGSPQDSPGWQGHGQDGPGPQGYGGQGHGQTPPPPGQSWPGHAAGGGSPSDPYASPPRETDGRDDDGRG